MSVAAELVKLQRELQAHVLEGDEAIAAAIDSSERVSAATRLQIYFDAYRLRLIEALEANYPVLAKLLGDDGFSELAQRYLFHFPSRHYSIRWFGHQLAQFLSEDDNYSNRPWLSELAAWEWKTASAFDALDAKPVTVDKLAVIAPDRWPVLSFLFHPSVQRMGLTTDIVSTVKAEAANVPLPSPRIVDVRSEWLIWRQGLEVQYRILDSVESDAFDAALDGATFSAICEIVARQVDANEAPLRAASLLKQWLSDGCVVELRFG